MLPFVLIAASLQAVRATTVITLAFFLQDTLRLSPQQTVQYAGIGFMVLALAGLFTQLVVVQRFRPKVRWMIRAGLPLNLTAFVLLCSGVGWFLSALGVFVRDVQQIIGIAVTATLFLSPIFYPVSNIPARVRPIYMLNPLSIIIEQMRAVVIWGRLPEWQPLLAVTLVTTVAALAGYAWFQRTRKGFADVL